MGFKLYLCPKLVTGLQKCQTSYNVLVSLSTWGWKSTFNEGYMHSLSWTIWWKDKSVHCTLFLKNATWITVPNMYWFDCDDLHLSFQDSDAYIVIWISKECFKQIYSFLFLKKKRGHDVSSGLDVWDVTSPWIQTRTFCSRVKTSVRSTNMPEQNPAYVMSRCNHFDIDTEAEGNDSSNKAD